MEAALYWIAGVSTALFFIRLVLMFIGIDGADAGDAMDAGDAVGAADAADAADFKIFSLMTFIVTFMVGGWVGLLMISLGMNEWLSSGLGGVIGFVAGVIVSYAIFSMRKLEHDGALREFEAEGLRGTVYVRIPEAGEGKGQVRVSIQNRMYTFDAVSDGPQIDSFKPVVVMKRVDEKTLRVCPTD